MTYVYRTNQIQFHFNMKEPARDNQGDETSDLAETDVQWNTKLELKKPEDRIMVSQDRE